MKTQTDRIECAQCRQMVKAKTARNPAPIPLRDTPIYAEMLAEREGRGRYSVGGWIKPDATIRMMYVPAEAKPLVEDEYGTAWVKALPDMSKFREQRKPLAKKGRKK